MSRSRIITSALLLVLIAFWGGHTVAIYRTAHEHLPVAQRFSGLQLASFMLRSAELVDRGDSALLRRKLLAVAKSELEPQPYVLPNVWAVAVSPFLLERQSANLRALSQAEAKELALQLQRLEQEHTSALGAP